MIPSNTNLNVIVVSESVRCVTLYIALLIIGKMSDAPSRCEAPEGQSGL